MVNKKYTTIQRIKRLENIVSQIYMSVEVIKQQLDKKKDEDNK
tara:strand:- start:107 stop:235 length:129 start_codon:yes stop_codon:yes gene_type:complete